MYSVSLMNFCKGFLHIHQMIIETWVKYFEILYFSCKCTWKIQYFWFICSYNNCLSHFMCIAVRKFNGSTDFVSLKFRCYASERQSIVTHLNFRCIFFWKKVWHQIFTVIWRNQTLQKFRSIFFWKKVLFSDFYGIWKNKTLWES